MSALFGLSACEGCGPPPVDAPSSLFVSSSVGAELVADGVQITDITLRGVNADGSANNATITATASGGRFILGDVGEVSGDGLTFTGTPDDVVVVGFRCDEGDLGEVTINAENGAASRLLLLDCIEPLGDPVISFPQDDEAPCSELTARPGAFCLLNVLVRFEDDEGNFIPQDNVALTVTTNSAVAAVPGDPTEINVLQSENGGNNQGVANVSATTDGDGLARIKVLGLSIDLVQSVFIDVEATTPGGKTIDSDVTVTSRAFANLAEIISPDNANVATGETASVRISVLDANGDPADGDTIEVNVAEDSGAFLSADGGEQVTDLTVSLGDGGGDAGVTTPGEVVIQFHAPDVTGQATVDVNIEYDPGLGLEAISETFTVTIFPEGQLIVNAVATPPLIQSDNNDSSDVEVTVQRLEGGQLQDVAGVGVNFVIANDTERIGFGTRTGPEALAGELAVSVTQDSDAQGTASATVSSVNDRVRGETTVDIVVIDPDTNNEVSTSVQIEVDRQPILQSIEFVSATPETIGVRGGAFVSTSTIVFRVLDDEGSPIGNVPVSFDTNATADPGASVGGNAITDANGIASTVLASGTQAGPVSVVANVTFNGNTLSAVSNAVVVIDGTPNFENSFIVCERTESIIAGFSETACSVQLVDRFTERSGAGLGVQFLVEGGSVNGTAVTDEEGTAGFSFRSNPNQISIASLSAVDGQSWSYGAIIPTNAGPLTDLDGFTAVNCFDNNSSTTCNVIDMCRESANIAYCPLPEDVDLEGENCWDRLDAFALTGDFDHASAGLVTAFEALTGSAAAETDMTAALAAFNADNALYFFDDDVADPASEHEQVTLIVDAYLNNRNRCGRETACLVNQPQGLAAFNFDDCALAAGCTDFTATTQCPSDGIASLVAHVRGEESFIDSNGNGVFDFIDANGNQLHDRGETALETFVDLPEPFVDANDSCFRDDLTGSLRLTPSEEFRLSEEFFDEDLSGDFGYVDPDDPDGPRLLGNGQYDKDKRIMIQSDIILQNPIAVADIGVPCGVVGQTILCPDGATNSTCEEVGPGVALAACSGMTFGLGNDASFAISYRVADLNGNCVSVGFGASYTAAVDGPAELFGDTDVDIGEAVCGFSPSPSTDAERPWCRTSQTGSAPQTLVVQVDCADGEEGANTVTVDVEHSEIGNFSMLFTQICPAP